MEIRKETVAAEPFILESVGMFSPMATEKGIELLISAHESVGTGTRTLKPTDNINVDVFKMRQVLRNVISNALKVLF